MSSLIAIMTHASFKINGKFNSQILDLALAKSP